MMYVAIFIGGALGSLLRELAVPFVQLPGPVTSTFMVNVVACFIIGVLYAIRHRIHAHVIHLAAVGFCGGLSTFSTFASDVYQLAMHGELVSAALAPTLEIAAGIVAATLGEYLARRYQGLPSR